MALAAHAGSLVLKKPSIVNPDKIREATARSWACSAAKARVQLNFEPVRSLDTRLRETAEWYRAEGWL